MEQRRTFLRLSPQVRFILIVAQSYTPQLQKTVQILEETGYCFEKAALRLFVKPATVRQRIHRLQTRIWRLLKSQEVALGRQRIPALRYTADENELEARAYEGSREVGDECR